MSVVFKVMNQFRTGGPQRELFAGAEDLADDVSSSSDYCSFMIRVHAFPANIDIIV